MTEKTLVERLDAAIRAGYAGRELLREARAAMSWRPICEAVEGKRYIVGWREEGEEREDFDWLEDGCWQGWEGHYQNFCTVALSGVGRVVGPSETAPYTYCIELPSLPPPPTKPEGAL